MKVNPYLFFNGDCEAAFTLYAKLFGGRIESMMTHEGTPAADQVPPRWRKKILHARMTLGESVLMGSDAPPGRYAKPQGFRVNAPARTVAKAESIFRTLAKGGSVAMPIQKTFWSARFGMVTDRFGIPWMVNCEKPA